MVKQAGEMKQQTAASLSLLFLLSGATHTQSGFPLPTPRCMLNQFSYHRLVIPVSHTLIEHQILMTRPPLNNSTSEALWRHLDTNCNRPHPCLLVLTKVSSAQPHRPGYRSRATGASGFQLGVLCRRADAIIKLL